MNQSYNPENPGKIPMSFQDTIFTKQIIRSMLCCMIFSFACHAGEPQVKQMPVFETGPHAGKHIVYEHDNFIAWIGGNGVCLVQPMHQGKPAGPRFAALWVRPYVTPPGAKQRDRQMMSFARFGAPVVIPRTGGKAGFSGLLDDGIPFEVIYEFKDNTVTASGGCKDHGKIEHPTQFRFFSRFTDVAGLGPDPTAEMISERCKGMEFVYRMQSKRKEVVLSFPTPGVVTGLEHPMEYVILRGTHAPREIEFRPNGRDGYLRGYIYAGNSLWKDFVIQYIAPGQKIRPNSTSAMMIIR